MKKCLCLIIALSLSLLSIGMAYAEGDTSSMVYDTDEYSIENHIGTRINYDFIESVDLGVRSTGSEKIKVELVVDTYETMEKLGFSSLKVQRWDGNVWVTDAEITNQYSYTTQTFGYSHTFTGLYSGALYCVKVTLFAKRTIGETQSMTVTSSVINCH